MSRDIPNDPTTDAARQHRQRDGFVDQARDAAIGRDPVPETEPLRESDPKPLIQPDRGRR